MAGKRGNGTGSISYEQGRHRWRAAMTFVGDDGLQQRKTFLGKTRDEVATALVRAQADLTRGLPPSVAAETVEAYLCNWLATTVQPNSRPATVRQYQSLIRHHIVPSLGSLKLSQVKPEAVRKLQAQMLAKRLSPKTVACARSIVSNALDQALRDGLLARNPVSATKPPRKHRVEPKFMTFEQAERFLKASESSDFHALWTVLLGSATRISEALGLTWDRIDFEHNVIRIDRQLTPQGGGAWALSPPKTDSGIRSVPMIPAVAEALHQQRARVLRYKARYSKHLQWPSENYVFCGTRGQPIWSDACRQAFKRTLLAADLDPKLSPHSLRHTSATFLLAAGVEARIVQSILGHADISMTMRYTHLLDSMLADAGERLAKVFPGAVAVAG